MYLGNGVHFFFADATGISSVLHPNIDWFDQIFSLYVNEPSATQNIIPSLATSSDYGAQMSQHSVYVRVQTMPRRVPRDFGNERHDLAAAILPARVAPEGKL